MAEMSDSWKYFTLDYRDGSGQDIHVQDLPRKFLAKKHQKNRYQIKNGSPSWVIGLLIPYVITEDILSEALPEFEKVLITEALNILLEKQETLFCWVGEEIP